jgi:8-oxo-dGTP diphosphatase
MRNISRHPIFVSVVCYSKGALLTLPRKEPPYKEFLALPEGPVKRSETLETAALRVLKESSGLTGTKMKLVGVYDDVKTGERRIPNVRSYIISFVALNWIGEIPLEGVRWLSDWRGTQLAYEHNEMILEAEEVIEMATKSRYLYAIN